MLLAMHNGLNVRRGRFSLKAVAGDPGRDCISTLRLPGAGPGAAALDHA